MQVKDDNIINKDSDLLTPSINAKSSTLYLNNIAYTVPDAVRDMFFSILPYGSEFVMYTNTYETGNQQYVMYYRRVGTDYLSSAVVSRVNNGDWTFSYNDTGSAGLPWYNLVAAKPYYCYSNIKGQGRYVSIPSGMNMIPLLLIVLVSLAVLKTVFGGVRLWRSSRRVSV